MEINIEELEKVYWAEDLRLSKEPEVEQYGHPFARCTNVAQWVRDEFFPHGVIAGYSAEENPTAKSNDYADGHDFLVLDGRYIIDFWIKYTGGDKDAPVMIDMATQPELLAYWYGDKTTWESYQLNNDLAEYETEL